MRSCFEARLADAGAAMKLPVMPGADDIVAVQPALAKRPADMVAHIGNRAELSVLDTILRAL